MTEKELAEIKQEIIQEIKASTSKNRWEPLKENSILAFMAIFISFSTLAGFIMLLVQILTSPMKDDMKSIKDQVYNHIPTQIRDLKTELKEDVRGLKEDIKELKENDRDMKESIEEVKDLIRETHK